MVRKNFVSIQYSNPIGHCFSKYCDLCQATRTAESVLGTADVLGHKYLPGINTGQEQSFDKICRQINATSYDLFRTVNLPDKYELENEANTNFKGIDEQLKERLKVGVIRSFRFRRIVFNFTIVISVLHYFLERKTACVPYFTIKLGSARKCKRMV